MALALAKAKKREAEVGDLIKMSDHWAVYIGNDFVVRWTIPSDRVCCDTHSNKPGETKKEKLQGTINVDYKIQNHLDHHWVARPADDIIKCQHEVSYLNCEHFAVDLRYGKGAYEKSKPQKGDLIEIFRGNGERWPRDYQHWTIYVGDGDVVHVTSNSSASCPSSSSGLPTVKKEKLRCVTMMDPWRVNNERDSQGYKVKPVDEIVKEANARVGKPFSYCPFNNNCEHFATGLRYGEKTCQQFSNKPI